MHQRARSRQANEGGAGCQPTSLCLVMRDFASPEDSMALSVQDALIHIMVVTASSDEGISQNELDAIADLVVRSPVFEGYDMDQLSHVANEAVDKTNADGFEGVLD